MKITRWLATLFLLALCGRFAHAAPPNVLLVFLDNTGWGDYGAYGGGALRGAPTPNIDRLASEGMRLQNFNTEAQCTPSRAALMSGRHPIRSGTHTVPLGTSVYGLLPWEITVAEALKEQNYATGIFGKWHLGDMDGRYPTDQGFDEWYGIPNSSGEALFFEPEALSRNSIAEDAKVAEGASLGLWKARPAKNQENSNRSTSTRAPASTES